MQTEPRINLQFPRSWSSASIAALACARPLTSKKHSMTRMRPLLKQIHFSRLSRANILLGLGTRILPRNFATTSASTTWFVSIVADTVPNRRASTAIKVLTVLGNVVASQLSRKLEDLESTHHELKWSRGSIFLQRAAADPKTAVRKHKEFYAGLRTHEEEA